MKIKSILVSQPAPNEYSPYLEMAKKEKIRIDFRPFIHVEGVEAKELRTQKIDLSHYNGVIMTSKNAVDHYFRLAEEMRFPVPGSMRYVCQSEAIANYLQKHVVYRKRKIGFGEKNLEDILPVFKKYPDEKYLVPCSDVSSPEISKILDEAGIDWTRAVMYRTVFSDISDIQIKDYDMLVFFSPQGVRSLMANFQDFKQGDTKISVFGNSTNQAAEEIGLRVDVMAPTKETPSMTMAIEKYIRNLNGVGK
ncbi:MAG: uroporphyrinogen-III synthase [Flavobacteriaceae bacterium]|jgi:uroporphyrinogen-III synthase|nr:uroporphyrinogen-III synthase [Flavobacteriaceae bacterium]